MNGKRFKTVFWLSALVLLFGLGLGCSPVDHWKAFSPDFEAALPAEATGTAPWMERFRPGVPDGAGLEIPPPGRPLKLSVEKAAFLTLQRNLDLQVQQLNPIITGTFERIERGRFDPEVFADFEYSEQSAQETSRATGELFSVDSTRVGFEAGLRQDLPSGSSLELSVDQEREQSNRAPDQRTARIGLSVTQSLLRGYGPVVNLAGVRQTELETRASLFELQAYTETLLAETETAFWNYVLAMEEIRIVQSSLALARQQSAEIQEQIEVGLLPQIEAAAARAEVARREQALIDANSQMKEGRLRLLHLMNLDEEDRQIELGSSPMIDPEPIGNQSERLRLAERLRPDLAESALWEQQGRLEIVATKNGLLPQLDVFLNLGYSGYADSFSRSFQEIDEANPDLRAGLRLSLFLGNRSAEGQHEAALGRHRQAELALDNLRRIVRLEVRLAVTEAERLRQQIKASTVTRRLEEQALQAEKERFEVGASTALLVAQVQRDLLASRIAEIRAVINYRLALVQLYLAEGSLLQRRGISLGENGYPLQAESSSKGKRF